TGCSLWKETTNPPDGHQSLSTGIDRVEKGVSVLHYNSPHAIEYILLCERPNPHEVSRVWDILLSISGDSSPIVTSFYRIDLRFANPGAAQYEVIVRDENVYLFDSPRFSDFRDNLARSRKMMLAIYEKDLRNARLFKI